MDIYTDDTRNWLDDRFKRTDEEGIYFAHQPIYGFRKGHSEPGIIVRYIITYQILKALSHLKFSSLLDVGGAEGYKAALIRKIFNVYVRSVDLSKEACSRAKEIYGIDSEQVDSHRLPYQDNEFDIVLCSETLEHVHNLQESTLELVRVCRNAVIITVPHESKKRVEDNLRKKIPHGHIHSLDTSSFDFARPAASEIISRRYHNPFIKVIATMADAMKRNSINNYSKFIVNIFNFFVPIFSAIFRERSINWLIKLDDYISNTVPSYSGIIFIIIKDKKSYSTPPSKEVSMKEILEFNVPYYYLGQK